MPTAIYPSLKDRVVIITGGGQALGRTYAHEFAAQGAIPVIAELNEESGNRVVQEIEQILLQVKKLGFTTIIVEQNAIAALKLADSALIIDMGQVAFSGTAQEVLKNEELRHEYLAI